MVLIKENLKIKKHDELSKNLVFPLKFRVLKSS